jgi:peptidoglycan/LPS O-acetylase OafA/YrhL
VKLPKQIPQFDFLRGVAVLAVMIYHVQRDVPSLHIKLISQYGLVGVDLFFVISGFLITGILLRTKGKKGYLTNFYAKRSLRIWPVYYLLLLFIFVVMPMLQPALHATISNNCRPWWASLFFLQNILMKNTGGFGPMTVTWSLCVEEQFYLVWPLLVLFYSPRTLKRLAFAAIGFSLVLRILSQHGIGIQESYFNTLTRLDGLAVGALLALYLPTWNAATVRTHAFWIFPAAALVALIAPHPDPLFHTMVAIAFGALVCLSLETEWMSHRPIVAFIGKISYALYLVHIPVMGLLRQERFRQHLHLGSHRFLCDIVVGVLSFAVSIGLATLSWYLMESQVLKFRKYFETRESPAKSTVTVEVEQTTVARAFQI